MVPSLKKTKFRRKATEDMKSMSSADEVMDSEALLIGEIPISLNCSTISLTLPTIFKLKKSEEYLVEVEGKHLTTEENEDHSGVTIESFEECNPQKVILEKPSVEMTRHIKPLYVRVHLNGRAVSKVLINNGLVVNVMSFYCKWNLNNLNLYLNLASICNKKKIKVFKVFYAIFKV